MDAPKRPTPIQYSFEKIPAYFRERPQWVCWKYVERDGRWTKPPYQAKRIGVHAKSTDPTTWASFDEAVEAFKDPASAYAGIGYAIDADSEQIVAVDLDHVMGDDADPAVVETSKHIVAMLDSYTEVSPSGTGIHIYAFGPMPEGRCRNGNVEMYSHGRYLTFTGRKVKGRLDTVEQRAKAIAEVHAKYVAEVPAEEPPTPGVILRERKTPTTDLEICERARNAANGEKFKALWAGDTQTYHGGDDSVADLALCSMLAFWTQDADQIDRIFRQSKLMRPKWDTKRGPSTYGRETIKKALGRVTDTYGSKPTPVADTAVVAGWPMLDAADWRTWEFPPVELIVDHLIPRRGLLWVGGRAKRGKSLFMLYNCLAIASGRKQVAGHFDILYRPKILYIAREDSGSRVRNRIADILKEWKEPLSPGVLQIVVRPKGFNLGSPEHLEWVREQCRIHGFELVVFDTWTALSPGANPMDAKDQTGLAQAVARFTEDFDGCCVVVDHSRKNRPEGSYLSSADILGPSQKWQAAETIIMLADTAEKGKIECFTEGKDFEESRFFLNVSPIGSADEKFRFGGTVEAVTEARVKKGQSNREAVLRLLKGQPKGLTRREIEPLLPGMTSRTIQRHLKALVKAKLVTVQDGLIYREAADGPPF